MEININWGSINKNGWPCVARFRAARSYCYVDGIVDIGRFYVGCAGDTRFAGYAPRCLDWFPLSNQRDIDFGVPWFQMFDHPGPGDTAPLRSRPRVLGDASRITLPIPYFPSIRFSNQIVYDERHGRWIGTWWGTGTSTTTGDDDTDASSLWQDMFWRAERLGGESNPGKPWTIQIPKTDESSKLWNGLWGLSSNKAYIVKRTAEGSVEQSWMYAWVNSQSGQQELADINTETINRKRRQATLNKTTSTSAVGFFITLNTANQIAKHITNKTKQTVCH